jgi:hydrogenase maturation protease
MRVTTKSGVVESSADPDEIDVRQRGTLVIGIGNNLLTDDGAGIHVIELLSQQQWPDDVELVDGGTLGFTLLEQVESAERLIVVDAAQLDAEPGTVRVFRNSEMDDFLTGSRRTTVHEVNLLDVMGAARFRGRLPRHYTLVGIQPLTVDWGASPTPVVAEAAARAAELIGEMIREAGS